LKAGGGGGGGFGTRKTSSATTTILTTGGKLSKCQKIDQRRQCDGQWKKIREEGEREKRNRVGPRKGLVRKTILLCHGVDGYQGGQDKKKMNPPKGGIVYAVFFSEGRLGKKKKKKKKKQS